MKDNMIGIKRFIAIIAMAFWQVQEQLSLHFQIYDYFKLKEND